MAKSKLRELISEAEELGLTTPTDVVLELAKQDTQALLDALKLKLKIRPQDLPLFTLKTPGAVPAPKEKGLILTSNSDGWEQIAAHTVYMGLGGGGGGGIGVEADPIFLASEAAGFAAGDVAKLAGIEAGAEVNNISDLNATDLTDGGATILHSHAPDHAAVSLDVNADTILALAGQALGLDTQVAGTVLAGPTSGAATVPTFRALVASDLPTVAPEGTYLISGGGVTWKSDYVYTVAAGTGYINGILYSWAQQDITLNAADALLDRIDMVGVDSTSTVFKVTGVAASDPSEPVVDPSTQLELAFVLVTANTTEPVGITSELIYAENAGAPTEWAWTTSGAGFNVDSASNPYAGTKDIEGTAVAANDYSLGTRGSGTIDLGNYTQLVFFLRFKNTWNNNRYLQIQFQNAGVKKGNALRISNGKYGLDSSNITTYQVVIIPILEFAIPAGTLVNQLRIIDVGGSIGFYIDNISVTTSGSGGTIITGITQEEADARYVRLPITWPVTKTVSNPQLVYTQRPQVVLFRAPAALTITRIHIHGNDSTPTSELAGDLKWADDVFTGGFANAAVIDVCDTTNGVFTVTSGMDDPTIAAGKYVYFQMDASPHADWVDYYIEVYYTLD